ncbi:ZGRF1 protein, partial [Thinocorus orbignyianus]|nr:ZGRF1 protein [Thinocorus orbignyianus]
VLYTHQKMKKSKTWQDGILKIRTGGNKATLFDDKGQCLESIFIKSQVNAGDNLESERYLITVEEVNVNEKSVEDQPKKAETPALGRNGVKPGVLTPRHLSIGLKRKFTGFQGPRQVEKKMPTMEDGENPTILPLSKQCQGTLPSNFYVTSPLFSTISKRDTNQNLPTDFHEGACTDNGTEHMSLSSLLSAPFLDRCEEAEKQNSDQFVVKSESSVITGHAPSSGQAAGHRAVSRNIRSTAQILALLKSKAPQGCREQTTSEVTECLSRFQASENADGLYNQNDTILPAFSGNPAKRLIQDIQHLPFAKETVNDKKEWNVEVLLNSAEQPCDKEVAGQRCGKQANNFSQGLKDPCNANSCFLPESTLSRMSDNQFVPSSGDVLCPASPTTFGKSLSNYREYSARLKENSPVKLQDEFQLRQSSELVPGDPELSVDVTLTETGIGEDVTQNAALRLHSHCEVMTHSKNKEVKCSTFDEENDGRRIVEDSANQTRIEVELLDDRHNVREINESQLSIEVTNSKKDPDGCAAHTVNGVSWIKSRHSDHLPGDANVNECHPKTVMFEKTESISCISTSGKISAMDKRTDEHVIQLECTKSPDSDLEHFWGTKHDDIKPGSPLLVLSQKSDPSSGQDHSSPEETAVGETEFENIETINAFHETCKDERIGMDCLKGTAVAENSSDLPDLVNNIALVRALTQHSTALESLQKMEENNSMLYE